MIVPAMIYYPDEDATADSWANWVLKTMGYNNNPRKIQSITDRAFIDCMVPMPELMLQLEKENKNKNKNNKQNQNQQQQQTTTMIVTPIEWSKALDGKTTRDYVARVEPSESGGLKMAKYVATVILEKLGTTTKATKTVSSLSDKN